MKPINQLVDALSSLLLDKQLLLEKDGDDYYINGVVLPSEPIPMSDFLLGYCQTYHPEILNQTIQTRNGITESTVENGRLHLHGFSVPLSKFIEM